MAPYQTYPGVIYSHQKVIPAPVMLPSVANGFIYPHPVVSPKNSTIAGGLNIFPGIFGLGGFGRMYAGDVGIGIGQLLVGILLFPFGGLWSAIDGMCILTESSTDGCGLPLTSHPETNLPHLQTIISHH